MCGVDRIARAVYIGTHSGSSRRHNDIYWDAQRATRLPEQHVLERMSVLCTLRQNIFCACRPARMLGTGHMHVAHEVHARHIA